MPHVLRFLVLTTAGWLNRKQEDVIDYLREENRVLREQLGNQRVRFTDAQRRRLAERGKKIGRKALKTVAGIATPDTILRWYLKLIARKYDGSTKRGPGPSEDTMRMFEECKTSGRGSTSGEKSWGRKGSLLREKSEHIMSTVAAGI